MPEPNRVDPDQQNEDAYEELIVSIEAGEGTLSLLLAVCDDSRLRDDIISRYEIELAPNIRNYWLPIIRGEPSLTQTIRSHVQNDEYLRNGGRAVVTITGAEQLFFLKLGEDRSEQEIFFGYLQWTREALRDFHFPIVLWVTHQLLAQLARHAPDFWSWRKGVFRFTSKKTGAVRSSEIEAIRPALEGFDLPTDDDYLLPLEDLKALIAQTEERQPKDPLLATLYYQMGRIQADRLDRGEAQDYQEELREAISYFRKAADLQTEFNQPIDLASSLAWLGYLFYLQERYPEAEPMFVEALSLSRGLLGEEHPNVATCLNNLAFLHVAQGDYPKAEPLFAKSLALRRHLLLAGEDDYFPHIGEQINNLENLKGFTDTSKVRRMLYEFEEVVLRIKSLIDIQSIRIQKNLSKLDEENLTSYFQLMTLLRTNIATWRSKISLYESAFSDASFSTDYFLEARNEIRNFIADLDRYTRLVEEIYRNLLEL